MAEDCLFCSIAQGDIDSQIVYEDETAIAFRDIAPMMPVHILVIPKAHYASIADDVPEDVLGHLLKTAAHIAHEQGIDESGFRVITNIGSDACQSVHHLHLHVLGGAPMNDGNPAKTC